MRIQYLPIQDASIYEEFDRKNTGLDEIIEVGKSASGIKSIRSLIQFDIESISSSLSNGTLPISTQFDLQLFVARADDLRRNEPVEIRLVSQSWIEGTGYFYQNTNVSYTSSREPSGGYFEIDGASWECRESGSVWAVTGSSFVASPSASFTMSVPVTDITANITTLVQTLVSGSIPNNGFLLKFPTTSETDTTRIGNIKFFSRNSHTVHLPCIIAKWNNQSYVTGTISGSSPYDVIVRPRNLHSKYKIGESIRVNLSVRDRYPQKTFDTVYSAWSGDQRLPSSSYFSIVDQQSDVVIIPFDQYSPISCDGTNSYIDFKIQSMYAGRYYKLMFKVIDSGYEHVFDNGYIFSVENV